MVENKYSRKELLIKKFNLTLELTNKQMKPKTNQRSCFFKKKYGSPRVFSASKREEEEIKSKPIRERSEEKMSRGEIFIN